MTPQLFKEQTLSEKVKLIRQRGTYLATRSINHYQIKLYALDKMFIEVWYTKKWFRKKAVKVEGGTITDGFLQPYLNMIRLKC